MDRRWTFLWILQGLIMDCQLVPVCISYGYTTIPDGPPLDSRWILDEFRIDSLTIFQVFAMHSLWIPHGFPYGSPMDSIRIPYGFPMDFLSIYDGVPVDLQFVPTDFQGIISVVFPARIPCGSPIGFLT